MLGKKSPEITTRQITRQLPCAFQEGDAMLKAHLETIEKAKRELFPIEHEIDKLDEKAKPLRDIVKDALAKIDEGTTEAIECTETTRWDEGIIIVYRDDNGDEVDRRVITEDDRQMKADV